jgi:hypothetical protein
MPLTFSQRIFVKIAIFGAVSFFLLVSGEISRAEDIEIDGISVSCESCVNYRDGRCVIPISGSPTILPCTEALEQLLMLSYASNAAVRVSAENLSRYLYMVRRKPDAALVLFQKLLAYPEAEELLLKNLSRTLEWYSATISELMLSGKFSKHPRFLHAIFEEPEDGSAIRTELRIVAALLHPDITLRDVSFQLGYSNTIYELERLKLWTLTADLLEDPWAKPFRQVFDVLDACRVIEEGRAFPALCSNSFISEIGEPFAEYLNKYVMIALGDQVKRERLPALDILQRFSKSDYKNHRTPTTHTLVVEALAELSQSKAPVDEQILLSEEMTDFLTLLAKNDEHIADQYTNLLLKVSISYWENGQHEKALDAVQTSFVIQPESSAARGRLLSFFESSPYTLSERNQKKLQVLSARESHWVDTLLWIGSAILTISLLLLLIRKRVGKFGDPFLTARGVLSQLNFSERYELKEILSFFGLTASANQDELGRAYRLRAKALHPDSQTGNIQEFNMLTSRYQRARTLLQKLN